MPLKTDAEVKIDQMTLPEAVKLKLIDRDALRQAVTSKSLNKLPQDQAGRLKYRPNAVQGKWAGVSGGMWSVDDASLICSIIAACRGHLHAQEKYVPLCDASGCSVKVQRTLEDQLALIGTAWKLFLKKDARALLEKQEAETAPGYLS